MGKNEKSLIKVDVNLGGDESTNKILDRISRATGIVLGAYKEKQKAKANFLSEINNRQDLSTIEKLAITSNYKKILKEYENQNNIVNKAIEMLEKPIEEYRTELIDDSWIMNYMENSKNICDDELQVIWAKILAGEFEQPGKYSLKTLEEMKKINKKDAKMIMKIAEFVMHSGNRYFIISDNDILKKHNISFEDIILLDEIGFIKEGEKRLTIPSNKTELIYNNLIVFLESKEEISIPIYKITEVGREIFSLLKIKKSSTEYLNELAEKNINKYKISYSEIVNISDDIVTYKDDITKLYKEDSL